MPGDTHRGLEWNSQFHAEDLELTLLPVWVLPVRYRDDKPPVRLLVNGQTGKIYGKAPVSWVKVTVMILIVIALIVAVVLLVREYA